MRVNVFLFIWSPNSSPCTCYFLGLYRTLASLLFDNLTFKYSRRDITFLMSGLNPIYSLRDIVLNPFTYSLLAPVQKKFFYFLPKAWSWILEVVYMYKHLTLTGLSLLKYSLASSHCSSLASPLGLLLYTFRILLCLILENF